MGFKVKTLLNESKKYYYINGKEIEEKKAYKMIEEKK